MENDCLVLGRIKEIHKYKLIISLPHNKTGICLISSISEEYNSYLSRLVNDDTIQNEVAELKTLFKKGQMVQLKLTKSLNTNKFDLSLIPSAVNSNVNLKQLKSGIKLQVAVKSREDKGYILETGIVGLNGFLPFENCSNCKYEIGQLVEVFPNLSEKSKATRVINFTTDSKLKSNTISPNECDFDSILPGMLLKTSMKLKDNGSLEGKFNGFPVTVQSDHNRISEQTTAEHILCVIKVDSALKQLECTTLQHLISPFKGTEDLLNIRIGHSEKNCIIKKLEKNSITVQIPGMKFATGLVAKGHIEQELRKLDVGNTITARFLDYNLMDNVVLLTTLTKLISQSYFSINQAKLGEVIKGTVKKFSKSGFSVQISSQLTGLIPIPHLSDKPIQNPNTVYKSGDVVQCRVFHIDLEENRLLLTVKKSLMTSTLPIVSCFDDFKTDMIVNGYISKIMEFGLVVVLFNNMRGWVPISRIPESQQKSLSVSFYIGKPIEVKVLRWNESTNKIELSLNKEEENEGNNEQINEDKIKIGEVYEAVIKQTKPDGFNVKLMRINRTAFLPFIQLSDSREHRGILQTHFTVTEECKVTVVIIAINNGNAIVSKKHSLISAAESNRLLTSIGNAVVESQWLGWVAKKESYGMFIDLPSGVKGLVRNKDICDSKPLKTQPSDLYEVGDTVEVKITEIDPSRSNKCLFSLKMSETYRAAEHMERGSIDFVKSLLVERKFIKSTPSCKKIRDIEIGDLISVEITKRCEWGFTLKLKDDKIKEDVGGFVRNQHLPDSVVTEGGVYRAVIIDIDLKELSVEVCMTGSLINAVSNRNNNCSRIDVDQNIPSDVLYFNNDFVVAALKGHAHGHFVFIATKRFWNDVTKEFMWIIKQRNPTIIKTVVSKDVFIGSLAINEAIKPTEENVQQKSLAFKNVSKKIKIKKGGEYPAYFHSITKNKLFFFISKKQKGFCDLIEYSNLLSEIDQLIVHPPEQFSLIDKTFKVTKLNKETGLASGHFLPKGSVETDDLICSKVISCFAKNKYRLRLPLGLTAKIDLSKGKTSPITPRVNQIIQCKVKDIAETGKISLTIVSSERISSDGEYESSNETDEDDVDMDEVATNEVDLNGEEDDDKQTSDEETDESDESNDDMPDIVTKTKCEENKTNLTNIYKRIHQSDEENEDDCSDNESCQPTPAKKVKTKTKKIDNVERELSIRKAEKRRETGEIIDNPTNEAEYELVLFNKPNDSCSWIKYMKFVLESQKEVDKVRSIAERAMKTLKVRDTANRFGLMKEYIDLEIEQLVLSVDSPNYDNQLVRFRKVFERGLAQKSKQFYEYVCDRLIEKKLFELAEVIAKKFIKEYHDNEASWFKLFLIRFVQRKFNVAKETVVNAERSLRPADYRSFSIRIAQTEIEQGNQDIGIQILISLTEKRPKDEKLRERILEIFEIHNLSEHASKIKEMKI